MMHTAESDSGVGCTPRSFFRYFVFMTPRCDAHHKARQEACNKNLFASKTPCNSSQCRVRLRAVLVSVESNSTQFQSMWSPTPRCVSQQGVTYFVNTSTKANNLTQPFQPVDQEPRWVRFIKNAKKSCNTATLNVSKRIQFSRNICIESARNSQQK